MRVCPPERRRAQRRRHQWTQRARLRAVGAKHPPESHERIDDAFDAGCPRRERAIDDGLHRDVVHEVGGDTPVLAHELGRRLHFARGVDPGARERDGDEAQPRVADGLAVLQHLRDDRHVISGGFGGDSEGQPVGDEVPVD